MPNRKQLPPALILSLTAFAVIGITIVYGPHPLISQFTTDSNHGKQNAEKALVVEHKDEHLEHVSRPTDMDAIAKHAKKVDHELLENRAFKSGAVLIPVGSKAKFHSIDCRQGFVVGELGGMRRLLSKKGKPVSGKFHSLGVSNGKVLGQFGSSVRELDLSGKPGRCSK